MLEKISQFPFQYDYFIYFFYFQAFFINVYVTVLYDLKMPIVIYLFITVISVPLESTSQ